MSTKILDKIDRSTSFIYDVEHNMIKNSKENAFWIYELEEICGVLSAYGYAYTIDYSSNITDIRRV